MEKGNYNGATEYFYQSLEIALEIGARAEVLENYNKLAMAYAAFGEFDSSAVYINLFASLKDSLSIDNIPLNNFDEKVIKNETHIQQNKIHVYNTILSIAIILIIGLIIILLFKRKH